MDEVSANISHKLSWTDRKEVLQLEEWAAAYGFHRWGGDC
jgi:hypothetical protein